MPRHRLSASFIVALFAMCVAGPAVGQVIITHAKALNGNVTPGDAAGYPVTLSQSGSYRLTTNLVPGAGASSAVHTTAPDITIDLNGFVISGGPAGGANNALMGIQGTNNRLTVRNGTIGAFRTAGIYARLQSHLTIEDVNIINSGDGIYNFGGSFARVHQSTIAVNTRVGISCGSSCHISDSIISGNGSVGISIRDGTVIGNTINSNEFGIYAQTSDPVGFGDNSVMNNRTGQVSAALIPLTPNACYPIECN